MNETAENSGTLEEHSHYKAYLQAFRIGSPIVIGIGVIGNVLSLIVLRSKFFRSVTSSVGFTLLAAVDLCILTIGLLPSWIGNITDGKHEIRAMGQAGCKAHVFLTYFFAFLGPWTLVLITIERLISVLSPTGHSRLCTGKRIVLGWIIIVIILFGVNLHFIWTFQLVRTSQVVSADIVYDCSTHTDHADFHTAIWPWVDFALAFAAPFLVILVCNMVIVGVLYAKSRRYGEMETGQVSRLDRVTSTTAMLVTVSAVYLLTTSPIVIVGLLLSYGQIPMDTVPALASGYLTIILVNLMFYINSAVNFFLYFLSNAHFRGAARHLICCQCYSPDMDGEASETFERSGSNSGRDNMHMAQQSSYNNKY